MPKLLYASSSKDSDMFYAVRVKIPDPFFYLDTGEKKYVFLDHREFGVYMEHQENTSFRVQARNPEGAGSDGIPHSVRDDVSLALVNPLMEEAVKMEGRGSGASKLAHLILQKYGLLCAPQRANRIRAGTRGYHRAGALLSRDWRRAH